MTRQAAATLLAALLALTACTTRTGAEAPETTTPSERTTRVSTTTTTTTTTNTPTPTTAADGTTVAACTDGTCEVQLTGPGTIPVNPALGLAAITIQSITGDAVATTMTIAGTSFSMDCTGDDRCQTSFVGTTPPTVYATGHPGAKITVNKVTIEVAAAANGRAILRLST